MASLLIYLAEASLVLALLYLVYVVLLRMEVLFTFNRFFLIGILALALLIPFVSFQFLPQVGNGLSQPVNQLSHFRTQYHQAVISWSDFEVETIPADAALQSANVASERWYHHWPSLLLAIVTILYVSGAVFAFFRFGLMLHWLYRMVRGHSVRQYQGARLVNMPDGVSPFSFMNYIFISDGLADHHGFDQIIAHEQVHIKQRHTFDLLFVQLMATILWFNPIVWRLIKSLKSTHEYIADSKMIHRGYSFEAYQTLLLSQLVSNNSFGLVHNFNLSFIKKRIIMMKKNKSGFAGVVKVAMAISLVAVFTLVFVQCNSAENDTTTELTSMGDLQLPVFVGDPQPNDQLDFSNSVDLEIANGIIKINDNVCALAEVQERISPLQKGNTTLVLHIDKAEKMAFVDKVFMELRKADMRKLIILGMDESGKETHIKYQLPPAPGPDLKILSTEELQKTNRVKIVEANGAINLDDNVREISSYLLQSPDNVVSLTFKNSNTYEEYTKSIATVMAVYRSIRETKSQAMYQQSYEALPQDQKNEVRRQSPINLLVENVNFK